MQCTRAYRKELTKNGTRKTCGGQRSIDGWSCRVSCSVHVSRRCHARRHVLPKAVSQKMGSLGGKMNGLRSIDVNRGAFHARVETSVLGTARRRGMPGRSPSTRRCAILVANWLG